ncbi:MAG: AsnC family transcriptional regulator [Rhodospirillaceae bacterium]|nr:AsnC family transcriptional regulator [Rhodospirillaceae bacterium]
MTAETLEIDAVDRAIIAATQGGLPLVPRPYDAIGDDVGLSGAEVQTRMQEMLKSGIIRRIGAVPNHYKLGFSANGMTVWDVADEQISDLGKKVGTLEFVSHCYHRPRHAPRWPYNMFAMVHGKNREEVETRAQEIAKILGSAAKTSDIIYSKRILKKTGLRISA